LVFETIRHCDIIESNPFFSAIKVFRASCTAPVTFQTHLVRRVENKVAKPKELVTICNKFLLSDRLGFSLILVTEAHFGKIHITISCHS